MQTDSSAPRPRFFDHVAGTRDDARAELGRTLLEPRASIPPKYFYDRLGSALFTAITELPEYYPTRTEAGILAAHREAIAACVGRGTTLIDLGAGDCRKAASMLDVLAPAQYVAVDISSAFVSQALDALQRQYPALDTVGVGTDFAEALWLPEAVRATRRTFFYPGSSIGNFAPADARAFLERLRAQAGPDGGLLIGVDLAKPASVVVPAYDDPLGVTAAFNLNVLRHVNTLIGSDFDVADWSHVARLDEAASRIEMHVEARRACVVRWPGGERAFVAGERIHTENSYKYTPGSFGSLLADAGWSTTQRWIDARGWFALVHAVPASRPS
ncbi:MAG: L-histidine N(alpha)-methyltransferase [Burkholderiales bacterium]|nr:MAG: L-histidine N(alpha)-methyltransferase [Burkholderiales bacterium]